MTEDEYYDSIECFDQADKAAIETQFIFDAMLPYLEGDQA